MKKSPHLQLEVPLENRKIQFSGHETFPLRQLWLKKAYQEVTLRNSKNLSKTKSTFSDDEAIARFGVGKNMVAAIRHWALACGVIEGDDKSGYVTTDLANLLFGVNGLDVYQENPTTSWLIHWKLAGQGHRSTTWYWLFNYVISPSLETDGLLQGLKDFAKSADVKVSPLTLKRDIECCLRSYVPRVIGDSPEEISDSVLGELSLLQQTSRGQFSFRRGPKQTLKPGLFAYCLMNFWESYSPNTETISFESVTHEYGSPGRVFKLDEGSIAERVQDLADTTKGSLIWSDTAGMRQILRTKNKIDKNLFLESAYE